MLLIGLSTGCGSGSGAPSEPETAASGGQGGNSTPAGNGGAAASNPPGNSDSTDPAKSQGWTELSTPLLTLMSIEHPNEARGSRSRSPNGRRLAFQTMTTATVLCALLAAADAAPPHPPMQGDYFAEMPRAWGVVVKADPAAHTLAVKLDRDGQVVTLPVRPDTELRLRNSWGELGDYVPGQHVMLFMYVDDDRHWTYPRAVQDDIQMTVGHGLWARITRVDRDRRTYATRREEKNKEGKITRTVDAEYVYPTDAKVWKGSRPGGPDLLQPGDEILQQVMETDGKRLAVEIFDRAGERAIRAAQDARHRQDEDRLGLPAYINDLDPLTGAVLVTVPWSSGERARTLTPGQVLAAQPVDGGKAFAAQILASEPVDQRQRLHLLCNARIAARLAHGQTLRLFIPGTGPVPPTGRAGVPAPAR